SARGFAFPAGFPKGDAAFTTAKVIAARAFPPAAPAWRHGAKPFDPELSEHGTHVAGIAAGNNAVAVDGGRTSVTGVAPRAYLGNYKVLTIPTASGVGLDGNSPEIAAGIEAAVRDGMDVINLSLGEPEIEPTRDLVVAAINAAADAGVVPVVAAGNDFNDFGRGSVGSPGTAAKAITVAAATSGRGGGGAGIVAGFSSSGPTPISLQLKPDVTAPGGEILSSVPAREGLWAVFSGTSMAAPHVAGSAALLRQRHPAWTVAHVKSALVLTGTRALADGSGVAEAAPLREGGGLVNLLRANDPLVLATPASLSFGLLRRGATATRTVDLTDAGGGAGAWAVSYEARDPGADLTLPATVTVPGRIEVRATVPSGAQDADVQGFVVLTRGAEQRRIPLWLHASVPSLGRHRTTALARTGIYRGNTAGRPALVGRYRYPEDPSGADVAAQLDGPEQVFRVRIGRPVQNFGVAVLSSAKNVRVQARIVVAGDENRQVGYTSLPINLNPYLPDFLEPRPVSGALRPAPGRYDIVFDSPTRAQAGRFRFRFWIDDTKPPALRFVARAVGMNAP
ncbi:MAG: S8 family serine peptidase, partial [Gaiellaceae bacterium]